MPVFFELEISQLAMLSHTVPALQVELSSEEEAHLGSLSDTEQLAARRCFMWLALTYYYHHHHHHDHKFQ